MTLEHTPTLHWLHISSSVEYFGIIWTGDEARNRTHSGSDYCHVCWVFEEHQFTVVSGEFGRFWDFGFVVCLSVKTSWISLNRMTCDCSLNFDTRTFSKRSDLMNQATNGPHYQRSLTSVWWASFFI